MSDLIPFEFHGDKILLVDVDGKPFVIFRRVVENLGLDYSTQLTKLRGRSWANRRDIPTVGADGKTRPMVAVSLSTLLMWLATVNETKVAESVRPKLIAYQSESSDAIYGYWAEGGSLNPRATEDQLSSIIGRAESQAKVLSALKGIVDKNWLEAKARHVAARALGEEPEVDLATRLLTVGEYLEDKGVTGAALRSLSTKFGKLLKAAYRDRYDREPGTTKRFVDGALRDVAVYTEKHRPLFDRVWSDLAAVTS